MNNKLWITTKKELTEAEARQRIDSIKTWSIDDIYDISEAEAQIMAEKHEIIKGHDIYFIDFGGYFKYSYIIFLNGHLLRYAGDYELHHSTMDRAELEKWYYRCIKNKLFTERQLKNKLKNYSDYQNRIYYLHNYYGDLENHISIFGDGTRKELVAEFTEEKKRLHYNEVTMAYYESAEFVAKCCELEKSIEAAREAMNDNFEYWKKAFRYEFGNYECIYGGRYEEAAAAATNGSPLNDIQKAAYIKAMEEYENYYCDHDF